MRGDLSETPAADVCRVLAVDASSGVLDIEGPEGRGTVVFDGGDVVAATSPTPRARLGDRLVSAGKLEEDALADVLRSQGRDPAGPPLGSLLVDRGLVTYDAVRTVAEEQVIDAVFDVVGWPYGAFRFEPEAERASATAAIPVRFAVDHLLVEVARRHEEWHDVRRVIPDLDAVPSFRPGATGAQTSLEPDEFTLLASIDGERSVRELADDLGYGHFEAARIVYGLTLLGIVEVALPEDEVGRALDEALRALSPEEAPEAPSDAPVPAAPPVDPADVDVSALLAELEGAPLPPRTEVEDGAGDPQTEAAVDEAAVPAAAAPPDDVAVDEAGTDEAAAGAAETDEADAGATDEPAPGGEVTEPPARADGAEVAELLRELSRLALDEPKGSDDPPPPSSPGTDEPTPPANPPKRREDPPRRRRLFGRG
jgi:hypothetical protein